MLLQSGLIANVKLHFFCLQAVSQKDQPHNNFFFFNGVEGSGMVDYINWTISTLWCLRSTPGCQNFITKEVVFFFYENVEQVGIGGQGQL